MEKETKRRIFDVIECALAQAGFKLLDGDADSLIIRDQNNLDFDIKVKEIDDLEEAIPEETLIVCTKDTTMYRTPATRLPNGDEIYVQVAEGEAIDVYRVHPDSENGEDDCLCFVEYNADEPEGQQLMVAAYRSCDEDTQYYAPYDQAK